MPRKRSNRSSKGRSTSAAAQQQQEQPQQQAENDYAKPGEKYWLNLFPGSNIKYNVKATSRSRTPYRVTSQKNKKQAFSGTYSREAVALYIVQQWGIDNFNANTPFTNSKINQMFEDGANKPHYHDFNPIMQSRLKEKLQDELALLEKAVTTQMEVSQAFQAMRNGGTTSSMSNNNTSNVNKNESENTNENNKTKENEKTNTSKNENENEHTSDNNDGEENDIIKLMTSRIRIFNENDNDKETIDSTGRMKECIEREKQTIAEGVEKEAKNENKKKTNHKKKELSDDESESGNPLVVHVMQEEINKLQLQLSETERLLQEALTANVELNEMNHRLDEECKALDKNITEKVSNRLHRIMNVYHKYKAKVNQIHNLQRRLRNKQNPTKRKNKKFVSIRQTFNDIKTVNKWWKDWTNQRKATLLKALAKNNPDFREMQEDEIGSHISKMIRIQVYNFNNSKFKILNDKLNQLLADVSDEKWYQLRVNELYDRRWDQDETTGRYHKQRSQKSHIPLTTYDTPITSSHASRNRVDEVLNEFMNDFDMFKVLEYGKISQLDYEEAIPKMFEIWTQQMSSYGYVCTHQLYDTDAITKRKNSQTKTTASNKSTTVTTESSTAVKESAKNEPNQNLSEDDTDSDNNESGNNDNDDAGNDRKTDDNANEFGDNLLEPIVARWGILVDGTNITEVPDPQKHVTNVFVKILNFWDRDCMNSKDTTWLVAIINDSDTSNTVVDFVVELRNFLCDEYETECLGNGQQLVFYPPRIICDQHCRERLQCAHGAASNLPLVSLVVRQRIDQATVDSRQRIGALIEKKDNNNNDNSNNNNSNNTHESDRYFLMYDPISKQWFKDHFIYKSEIKSITYLNSYVDQVEAPKDENIYLLYVDEDYMCEILRLAGVENKKKEFYSNYNDNENDNTNSNSNSNSNDDIDLAFIEFIKKYTKELGIPCYWFPLGGTFDNNDNLHLTLRNTEHCICEILNVLRSKHKWTMDKTIHVLIEIEHECSNKHLTGMLIKAYDPSDKYRSSRYRHVIENKQNNDSTDIELPEVDCNDTNDRNDTDSDTSDSSSLTMEIKPKKKRKNNTKKKISSKNEKNIHVTHIGRQCKDYWQSPCERFIILLKHCETFEERVDVMTSAVYCRRVNEIFGINHCSLWDDENTAPRLEQLTQLTKQNRTMVHDLCPTLASYFYAYWTDFVLPLLTKKRVQAGDGRCWSECTTEPGESGHKEVKAGAHHTQKGKGGTNPHQQNMQRLTLKKLLLWHLNRVSLSSPSIILNKKLYWGEHSDHVWRSFVSQLSNDDKILWNSLYYYAGFDGLPENVQKCKEKPIHVFKNTNIDKIKERQKKKPKIIKKKPKPTNKGDV